MEREFRWRDGERSRQDEVLDQATARLDQAGLGAVSPNRDELAAIVDAAW
jgi:hypothetical protein